MSYSTNKYFGPSSSVDLNGLTEHQVQQIENIENLVISHQNWSYLTSINQSLSTASNPTFGRILLTNGLSTAPSLTFTSDTNSGIYSTGVSGEIGVSSDNVLKLLVSNSEVQVLNSTFACIGANMRVSNGLVDKFTVQYSSGELYTAGNVGIKKAVGTEALEVNGRVSANQFLYSAGSYPVGLGYDLPYSSNSTNTFIGNSACNKLTSGGSNTALGSHAGANFLITGFSNVLLGYNTNVTAADTGNAIAIGSSVTAGTNEIVIGNSFHTSTRLYGNVGINQAPGTSQLEVTGNIKSTGDYLAFGDNRANRKTFSNTALGVRSVSQWTAYPPAVLNSWVYVCWSPELGLFCAISGTGTGNRVMTSNDGITWTIRTSAADNNWMSVCWSPELGLFCAVSQTGSGNRVMTSPDGITWTSRTSAADTFWRSVCWSPELGLFCAVSQSGSGNRVMTSNDGIVWTAQTSAADNNWNSVCWSPELRLFCAVSQTGTGNRVMTSPDGIVWSLQTSAADNNWRSICWSPELGLFCVVSLDGSGNRVMTSPDGINWTIRSSAANNSWITVCWCSELGLFCAVAFTGVGNGIMTSPDGINWTTRTSAADQQWYGVCWSPELGIFCAVSYDGAVNRVMTSRKVINRNPKFPYFGFSRWEDFVVSPFSSSTGPATKVPSIVKLADNGAGSRGLYTYAFNNTQEQELYFSIQMPHSYEEGTYILPHVHCTAGLSSTVVEWGLEYQWINVNGTINLGGTTIITQPTTLSSTAYIHNIAPLPQIAGTLRTVSSILLCRLYRKAGGTNTDVYLLSFDVHYRINSIGSATDTVKGSLN